MRSAIASLCWRLAPKTGCAVCPIFRSSFLRGSTPSQRSIFPRGRIVSRAWWWRGGSVLRGGSSMPKITSFFTIASVSPLGSLSRATIASCGGLLERLAHSCPILSSPSSRKRSRGTISVSWWRFPDWWKCSWTVVRHKYFALVCVVRSRKWHHSWNVCLGHWLCFCCFISFRMASEG